MGVVQTPFAQGQHLCGPTLPRFKPLTRTRRSRGIIATFAVQDDPLLWANDAVSKVASALSDAANQEPIKPHFGSAWAADKVAQLSSQSNVPEQLRDLQNGASILPEFFQGAKNSVVSLNAEDVLQVVKRASEAVTELGRTLSRQMDSLTAGTSSGSSAAQPHFGARALQESLQSLPSLTQLSDPQNWSAARAQEYLVTLQQNITELQQQLESALSALGAAAGSEDPLASLQALLARSPSPPEELEVCTYSLTDLTTTCETTLPATTTTTTITATGLADYPWTTWGLIAAGILIAIAISTSRGKPEDAEPDPLPPLVYDVDEVGQYWAQRPIAVASRAAVVLFEAAGWGTGLGLDILKGDVRKNAAVRAARLRRALERLGPAYVKVAQAVSTRVDLLEPEYLMEIELLQDQVPPFSNILAEATMERAFGRPTTAIFQRLSPEPVAAASLGQVYRGKLRPELGGAEVAVKVQRPGVLLSVALDLFLMRWMALILDSLPQVNTTWVGIIDEWAGRFFHELDYSREAVNAVIFKEQMAGLDGITVPEVIMTLSSQEVLTTAWVEGEKLNESTASDVRQLCTTLLNCYLIQLLETGLLHADPHPGNLLRTPDGKICILDFGLMTEVTEEQRLALVEYIAHLSSEDYESIPRDLFALGFIPPGAPDPIESGLVEPLGRILKQLSRGGGVKGVNIDEITLEMEALTADYPFQIPSYFALILRAFSVIEGIALRSDPTYSIVQECFPYLSRRLLTDDTPRVRGALQQMLYGKKKRLDIGRLQRMANGFGDFTVDGLTGQAPQPAAQGAPILSEPAKDALRVIFSRTGSYVQEVFVEESVAAVDAIGRELASQVSRAVLGSLPAMVSLSFVRALGPLRPFILPVPTPLEVLSSVAPVVAPTEEDQEALVTARSLLSLLQRQPTAGLPSDQASLQRTLQIIRELQPLLPELLPGIVYTGELFVRALLRRISLRIAEEAAAPPPRRATDGTGAQPPAAAAQAEAAERSRWLEDIIAASPLWLLLPQSLLSGPAKMPSIRKQSEQE